MLVGQTALEESGQPSRARRAFAAASTTRREAHLRPHLVLVVPVRAARDPLRDEAQPAPRPAEGAEEEAAAPAAAAPTGPRLLLGPLLALGLGDRLDEPGGDARGPVVPDRDAGVRRPAVGDELAVALDRVVEAEASAAHVAAARPDREPVVEASRVGVARVRLEGQRVDALLAQLRGSRLGSGAGTRFSSSRTRRGRRRGARRPARPSPRSGRSPRSTNLKSGKAPVASQRSGVRAPPVLAELITPPAVRRPHRRRRLDRGGIPDFRSPTGIWAEVDPMEYASLRVPRGPGEGLELLREAGRHADGAEPNEGIARSPSSSARPRARVTQNIDLLTRARERWSRCTARSDRSCSAAGRLDESMLPCPLRRRRLKPDVVFFGELLPQARSTGLRAARSALMLVVGSRSRSIRSPTPLETLRSGGSLAIVNRGETTLDAKAD